MKVEAWIEGIFLFSVTWSIGGSSDRRSRQLFNEILRLMTVGALDDALMQKYGIITKFVGSCIACLLFFLTLFEADFNSFFKKGSTRRPSAACRSRPKGRCTTCGL
jgi:hypothetical protein